MESCGIDVAYIILLKTKLKFETASDKRRFAEWLLNREATHPHPTAAEPKEDYLYLFSPEARKRVVQHWRLLEPRGVIIQSVPEGLVVLAGTWRWVVPIETVSKLRARNIEASDAQICACYLRYLLLGSAGQQAAIPPAVWSQLLTVGVGIESFASALNATLPVFGSAYPSVDGIFGGMHTFANLPLAGVVECNPPFLPELIELMSQRVLEELKKQPITFILFMPVWEDWKGYKPLASSEYLKTNIIVEPDEHYYTDVTKFGQLWPAKQRSRLMILQSAQTPVLSETWKEGLLSNWCQP